MNNDPITNKKYIFYLGDNANGKFLVYCDPVSNISVNFMLII